MLGEDIVPVFRDFVGAVNVTSVLLKRTSMSACGAFAINVNLASGSYITSYTNNVSKEGPARINGHVPWVCAI
jgi:hypothetical protein